MRKRVIAAACGIGAAVVLVPAPSLAKLQCKPGETVKCSYMGKAAPPKCWCAAAPTSGLGSGSRGKAEIKKKNVPTVKPNT